MDAEKKKEHAAALKKDVDIGARVERLLNDSVWLDIIEPYLVNEQTMAQQGCLWSPNIGSGKTITVDEVALKSAFYSGGSASIERLILRLNAFVRAGREATESLQSLDKDAKSKA